MIEVLSIAILGFMYIYISNQIFLHMKYDLHNSNGLPNYGYGAAIFVSVLWLPLISLFLTAIIGYVLAHILIMKI